MKTLMILNGPNLNLLGEREPHIYGHDTLADIERMCVQRAARYGYAIDFRQSNFEGDLIESVHAARQSAAGIVINPAGYTFTSVALVDSLKAFEGPILEVHLSNIHKREPMYHNSLVSKVATAVVAGLGAHGYVLAIDAMAERLLSAKE
jgi:3-dehydroquinate dehydratase II